MITDKFFPQMDFDKDGHKDLLECASLSISNLTLVLDGNCGGSALVLKVQLSEPRTTVLERGLV